MKYKIRTYSLILTTFLFTILTITLVKNNQEALNNASINDNYVDLDKDYTEDIIEPVSTIMTDPIDTTISLAKEVIENNNNDTDANDDLNSQIIVSEEPKKEPEEKPIIKSFSWPANGNIILGFSPNNIIYDEYLDQYRTSNSIYFKTAEKNLLVMSDSRVKQITLSNTPNEIVLESYEYEITLKGFFDKVQVIENAEVKKGTNLATLNQSGGENIIEISVKSGGNYIDPAEIINS